MDNDTFRAHITRALALSEDASRTDIDDRINSLREAAGEDGIEDLSDLELIRRGQHEQVTINADGSATVSLYCPTRSGTEEISELTIRRPKAKDLRKMDEGKGSGLAKAFAMLAALSKRAPSEIEELDGADLSLCSTVIGFLQKPPRRTGSSS